MKILWTHNFDPKRVGAGSFMYTFTSGMRDFGVEIDLMYLGNLRNPLAIYHARKSVRERSLNYDIVHAQFGSACAFATSAALGPKIVSLRGSDWHRYQGSDYAEALHGLLAMLFTHSSLASFDSVITMSSRMTNEVKAAFPNSRVTTIADPINTSLFRPHDRGQARIKIFNSTTDDPWVLFTTLSRSNPIKRIDLAMDAVHLARQRLPGLEIRVATGIPHASMPMFVSACDVALCTSVHEGWPNSIKEAIACGIPFVSTDVSDLREVASRHPCCHVSVATPEALADHLVQALEAPRDNSLRWEAEEMGIDVVCKRLLQTYRSVLE